MRWPACSELPDGRNENTHPAWREARAQALLGMIEDGHGLLVGGRVICRLMNHGWTRCEVQHAVNDLLESGRARIGGTGVTGISLIATWEDQVA